MPRSTTKHQAEHGIQAKRGNREYIQKGDQNHNGEVCSDRWSKLVETHKQWEDSCGAELVLPCVTVVKLGLNRSSLAVGPPSVPGAGTSSWEPIPYEGMPYSHLM